MWHAGQKYGTEHSQVQQEQMLDYFQKCSSPIAGTARFFSP